MCIVSVFLYITENASKTAIVRILIMTAGSIKVIITDMTSTVIEWALSEVGQPAGTAIIYA